VVPYAGPGGSRATIRLSRAAARERRTEHEHRLAELLEGLAGLDLDPIVISSAAPEAILAGFVGWAQERVQRREGVW